jgi:hypothetical protein
MRFSEKTPAFRAKEGGYLKYCHRFTKTIIMANNTRIPLMVYLLVLLLVFTGIGGIYGGYALVTAPDGSKMIMSTEILSNSPFRTFLVPGIILLLFNGLLPLLIAWGLFVRPPWQWPELFNLYHKQHWCWTFSLYYGFILIIWINVQIIMLSYSSLLQPVFALTGALISILTLFPSVFHYYRKHL